LRPRYLCLCIYDAIHDALFASDVSPLGNDFEDAIFARNALERRIKELEGRQRERELTELRLYRLAKDAVPWKSKEKGYAPSGELGFLSEDIVPDDTWATFMTFSESWLREPWRAKDFDKHLPRIYEIDEDDWEQDDPNIDTKPEVDTELINKIDEKPSEAEGLRAELKTLESALSRQRLLIYIVIGLVIWLLFTQH